jgi:glutamine synthetase
MQREQIVFVGTSDLSGHFRGKSFPVADLPGRLEHGIGIAPTNIFLSAFGTLQMTVFGTRGEVFLLPDAGTRVMVPFEGSATEYFFVGDIKTAAGAPWNFCPRQVLRRALERLRSETGLELLASFEQELIYSGGTTRAQPYELDSYRRQGLFGEVLLAAMRTAGVVPDGYLAEFGVGQYEVTSRPAVGLRAADDAVITRELAHAVAYRLGQRASFTPLADPAGTSNGTHIHFSFLDGRGAPVLHDAFRPLGLATFGEQFAAGILQHLPDICAVTAPSVPSYYRLRPNRWAPQRADLGALDRGAALRICPLAGDAARRAAQCNLEFRVADATASPYLALAMLVQAGLDGVRRGLDVSAPVQDLPRNLGDALDRYAASSAVAQWLGPELHDAYLKFKRAETKSLEDMDESDICRRYADAY